MKSCSYRGLLGRLFLTVALAGFSAASWAQADRSQARSMVISRYGIVASEHPLASQAGAAILAKGGNAIEAAIAANAAMGVVAPMMCGMGGDLFAIVYEAKTGKIHGLNASGWAPTGLTLERMTAKGLQTMPLHTIDAVTVPGAVAGWDALLHQFGRLPLAELLAPAIELARDGFPVSELTAGAWKAGEEGLRRHTNTAAVFLPRGRAPEVGELFSNPAMAWAYGQVAQYGRQAFYEGAIAQRLLEFSQRAGGAMTAGDLAQFQPEWITPISTSYRGWTVYEIPPSGQGIAALMMLNLMENFPLGEFGRNSAATWQVMIEAKKLAYADLRQYIADPRFAQVPVSGLLSKGYARDRARLIDLGHAADLALPGSPPPMGNDTTYLCAVDRAGNMISLIQSLYYAFGSGLVAEGTGFALQNRGALFSLDPRHPNVLAGRKRPLHTIIPAFMEKGQTRIAFGIMGGWNQAQAHAQFVANVADHRLNLQAALEAPRFTKMSFDGRDVQMESRIPESIRAELAAKGHQIGLGGDFIQAVGGGQAVMRDFEKGLNYGASDPRKDGAAIPEPVTGAMPSSP